MKENELQRHWEELRSVSDEALWLKSSYNSCRCCSCVFWVFISSHSHTFPACPWSSPVFLWLLNLYFQDGFRLLPLFLGLINLSVTDLSQMSHQHLLSCPSQNPQHHSWHPSFVALVNPFGVMLIFPPQHLFASLSFLSSLRAPEFRHHHVFYLDYFNTFPQLC